jgi:glucarate dehydratase
MDAFDLGRIRMRISERFYWSKDPLIAAAVEMACIDLQGKATGLPAYRLLGGALRDEVPVAAYAFYRWEGEEHGAVSTPDEMAEHAADLVARFGFETVKLKGGVFEPRVEVETMQALRDRLGPQAKLRFDPNAAWTPGTAIEMAPPLEEVGLEYYEDPTADQSGMALVRSRTRLPLSTNMCVTDFSHLGPAAAIGAIDVVLADPWYWGGPTRVQHLATAARVLGLGIGMHSGMELGVGMAVMAHTAVTVPNMTFAIDAHYHHLLDDVVVGEMLLPVNGKLAPPDGPGWGVTLDEEKVGKYREIHESGRYRNIYIEENADHGPDPNRPGWFPVMPRW